MGGNLTAYSHSCWWQAGQCTLHYTLKKKQADWIFLLFDCIDYLNNYISL